jgi:hypothetical protein
MLLMLLTVGHHDLISVNMPLMFFSTLPETIMTQVVLSLLQTIIFLYLMDNDTSKMILFSSGMGKKLVSFGTEVNEDIKNALFFYTWMSLNNAPFYE